MLDVGSIVLVTGRVHRWPDPTPPPHPMVQLCAVVHRAKHVEACFLLLSSASARAISCLSDSARRRAAQPADREPDISLCRFLFLLRKIFFWEAVRAHYMVIVLRRVPEFRGWESSASAPSLV